MTDRFVHVRVKVIINADGEWAAYSHTHDTDDSDGVLYDMMDGQDIESARSFYLVADIPLPKSVEIHAKLEHSDDR